MSNKYQMAFGALPHKKDIREYKVAKCTNISLPDEFELDMPEVKNQGSIASCVAFSISTIVEYYNHLQELNDNQFSTGFIYGNRRNVDYVSPGMQCDKALQNVLKWGDVINEKFDYNVEVPEAVELFEKHCFDLAPDAYNNRISEYYWLDGEQEIKTHLMKYGPVLISCYWYKDYTMNKKTYVMEHQSDEVSGHHAMVIYGWNKNGWKIQNSWGTYWGHKGRAIFPYDTHFWNCYGCRDEITTNINADAIDKLKQQLKDVQELLTIKNMELEKLENREEQNQEYIHELKQQISELQQQLTTYLEELNRLYLLEEELLEIKKPFKKMPKWLAELINAILNLFK